MKIGIIGSINIDQVVETLRIPQKGETLMGSNVVHKHGGKGANQAVALAKLGAEAVMFGKVGDDDYGNLSIKNFSNNNVNASNVEVETGTNTGLAIITVAENDNTIVVIPGANAKVDKEYIDRKFKEIKKCEIIILQNEIPFETNAYIIDLCAKNKIKVALNPAPAMDIPSEIVEKLDFLTPNEHEAKLIFKNADIDKILQKYPEKVIVTLGAKGAATCIKGNGIKCIPARQNTKVIDTTGAGDTFNAAFFYAITKGYNAEKAMRFANIAAGLSTEKMGAQCGMPSLNEVLAEMK